MTPHDARRILVEVEAAERLLEAVRPPLGSQEFRDWAHIRGSIAQAKIRLKTIERKAK